MNMQETGTATFAAVAFGEWFALAGKYYRKTRYNELIFAHCYGDGTLVVVPPGTQVIRVSVW